MKIVVLKEKIIEDIKNKIERLELIISDNVTMMALKAVKVLDEDNKFNWFDWFTMRICESEPYDEIILKKEIISQSDKKHIDLTEYTKVLRVHDILMRNTNYQLNKNLSKLNIMLRMLQMSCQKYPSIDMDEWELIYL